MLFLLWMGLEQGLLIMGEEWNHVEGAVVVYWDFTVELHGLQIVVIHRSGWLLLARLDVLGLLWSSTSDPYRTTASTIIMNDHAWAGTLVQLEVCIFIIIKSLHYHLVVNDTSSMPTSNTIPWLLGGVLSRNKGSTNHETMRVLNFKELYYLVDIDVLRCL